MRSPAAMMELEVDRQLVYPGEVLQGRVRIGGGGPAHVTVSLHGEEVYRPYLGLDTIVPVLDEAVRVECQDGSGEFSFTVPEDLSPSYSSDHLRCAYYLKAIRDRGDMTGIRARAQSLLPESVFHDISRLHLTVAPAPAEYESTPHIMELKDENLLLEVQVDQVSLEAGDTLTGSFLLTRLKEDGGLPQAIVLSLAAIEESTRGHRKVLWRMENSVQPGPELPYPLTGVFEFPIALNSPTSGDWRMFKVHCGFRVKMDWGDRDQRESLPIQLCHRIVPQGPARFMVEKAQRIESV